MAEVWTAEYGQSSVENDEIVINNVRFLENSVLKYTKQFRGYSDKESLDRGIQNQLNVYNKVEIFDPSSLNGPFIPTVVQPPLPPTPEQIARDKYFKDYRSLQHAHTLVGMGAMENTDPYYTGLQQTVGEEFRPEYIA